MLARVFTTKTSMSPTDDHAYFGEPDMFTPDYDEVHISCTFTWDIGKVSKLKHAWEKKSNNVKVGGIGIYGESKEPFKSGIYLKEGITITSRGCPNNCSFCRVNNGLIEFDEFPEGNIIQDNNFLACSDSHRELVYKMLRKQKAIEFKGGLEAKRITDKIVQELRGLNIKSLWLACDHDSAIQPLREAVKLLLKGGFTQNHLYCYVLIGQEEMRLREVFEMGCMPFAQLYQPPYLEKVRYTPQAKAWQRTWCRPAAYKTFMKQALKDKGE